MHLFIQPLIIGVALSRDQIITFPISHLSHLISFSLYFYLSYQDDHQSQFTYPDVHHHVVFAERIKRRFVNREQSAGCIALFGGICEHERCRIRRDESGNNKGKTSLDWRYRFGRRATNKKKKR